MNFIQKGRNMFNIYPLSRKIKVYGRGDETKSRYFMRHQFILPATTTKKLENFYWILSIVSVSAKSTQTHHFRWWRWWWLVGWLAEYGWGWRGREFLPSTKQARKTIHKTILLKIVPKERMYNKSLPTFVTLEIWDNPSETAKDTYIIAHTSCTWCHGWETCKANIEVL